METAERQWQVVQDQAPASQRFGYCLANGQELRIERSWDGDAVICTWQPQPYHAAGSPEVLNNGIIATLIDCHSVHAAGVATDLPGRGGVTASLWVTYLRPIPLAAPVVLRARIAERAGRKIVVACSVASGGRECARGKVVVMTPATAATLS
jgi:acyl-coenzyme A thioesterase PaaI-like protein